MKQVCERSIKFGKVKAAENEHLKPPVFKILINLNHKLR